LGALEAVPPKPIANEPFLGMWFLGIACMARVNNASTNHVSCCDPRVAIRHTRQIDFCEQKSMYRKLKALTT